MQKQRYKGRIRYYEDKDHFFTHVGERENAWSEPESYYDVKAICPSCSHVQIIPVQKEFEYCKRCSKKIINKTKGRFKWKLKQMK